MNMHLVEWDLREIIEDLIKEYNTITEIYLFGSRAYGTDSYRSDIDLLAFTDGTPLPTAKINSWLPYKYPPVDLFVSCDHNCANSCSNGSAIFFRKDDRHHYNSLVDQIDAIKLWDIEASFSSFECWKQETVSGSDFTMSIIPAYPGADAGNRIDSALEDLEKQGIKTYFAGSTWKEIGTSIVDIVSKGLELPTAYQKKARVFSFNLIKLKSEYDFQNFIHLLLKPIFPDIEPENAVITIDGNQKIADFGISGNKVIIEAKHINGNGKKIDVIKTLDGLENFYSDNPNVRCLIFLILYEADVDLDSLRLEERFSFKRSNPPILVKFMKNTFR